MHPKGLGKKLLFAIIDTGLGAHIGADIWEKTDFLLWDRQGVHGVGGCTQNIDKNKRRKCGHDFCRSAVFFEQWWDYLSKWKDGVCQQRIMG